MKACVFRPSSVLYAAAIPRLMALLFCNRLAVAVAAGLPAFMTAHMDAPEWRQQQDFLLDLQTHPQAVRCKFLFLDDLTGTGHQLPLQFSPTMTLADGRIPQSTIFHLNQTNPQLNRRMIFLLKPKCTWTVLVSNFKTSGRFAPNSAGEFITENLKSHFSRHLYANADNLVIFVAQSSDEPLPNFLTSRTKRVVFVKPTTDSWQAADLLVSPDWCSLRTQEKPGLAKIFTWTSSSRKLPAMLINRQAAASTSNNKPNYCGSHFLVSALPFPPFVDYTQDPLGSNNLIPGDGLDLRIMSVVARRANFTYELVEPSDGAWGKLLANGQWLGVVGQLHRAEVDFSVDLGMNLQRYHDVAFTRSFYSEHGSFVVLKPPPLPRVAGLALLVPFDTVTWILFFVSIVVAGAFYRTLEYMEAYFFDGPDVAKEMWAKRTQTPSATASTIMDTFLVPCKSLLMQPSNKNEEGRRSPMRIFWTVWAIYCFIIASGYTSMLIAFLSTSSKVHVVETLDQLADSDLKWGIDDSGTVLTTLLTTSQGSGTVYEKLGSSLQILATPKEAMEKVMNGGFAYIALGTYLQNLIISNFTDPISKSPLVSQAKERFHEVGFCFGIPMGSPLAEAFDPYIAATVEADLTAHWLRNVMTSSGAFNEKASRRKKERSEGEESFISDDGTTMRSAEEVNIDVALSVEGLAGIFTLLIVGETCAFLVFLIEILTDKYGIRTTCW